MINALLIISKFSQNVLQCDYTSCWTEIVKR